MAWCTSNLRAQLATNIDRELGKRHVSIPDTGGRGAAEIEAVYCNTELVKLRGGHGILEGADHGTSDHHIKYRVG